jgi:choice-of-anchor B domain-containing protein
MRIVLHATTVLLTLSAATRAVAQTTATGLPPAAVGFGSAAAFAGGELFVGRPGSISTFPSPASEVGGIHIFRRGQDGQWAETGAIKGSDATLGDGFGSVLAVRGTLMVVGSPQHAGGGTAYVFDRGADGKWTQSGKLVLADGAAGDEFGAAMAIGDGMIVVGAPGRDSARGVAYAFRRTGRNAAWSAPTVVARGADAGVRLGTAIALDGSRALIGAPGPLPLGGNPGGGQPQFKPGSAAIHALGSSGTWTEVAQIAPGTDTVRAFGYQVHLAGSEAMVSSPLANRGRGTIYLFSESAAAWSITGILAPAAAGRQELFGFSFAVTSGQVLAGAPMASQGTGAVYVFARGEAGWQETQKLTTTASGLGVMLGWAVAASGETAFAGGPMAEFFEGTGLIYARNPAGEWTPAGTVADRPSALTAVTGGELKCTDGKADQFNCQDVDLQAFIPTAALGARRGIMLNDIWGWTDPETGREIAIVGRMDATLFVDVSNPANPVFLGELPLHAGATPNLWRDMKVYRDHVFVVSDGAGPHGMQVFDLTRLRNVTAPPATFTEDAHYDKIASAHNIVINESTGFAYTVGNSAGGETCGGALHMIDIRNPKAPTFAGCFADPSTGTSRTGYTHDAQCVLYHGPDTKYQGREICFNASETAVGVADVTDKAAPKPIAMAAYPNVGYSHQGWLSDDHRYFYLNDELDELAGNTPKTRTLVWDMTSLDEPVLLTEFLGTTSASDHNLYIRGRYMYQSNYVSGLRVIDVADPAHPKEVGYFDTVPFGENVPGFAGSWSNYPFFKSGTIVVTSMREGLFVLKHRKMELVP